MRGPPLPRCLSTKRRRSPLQKCLLTRMRRVPLRLSSPPSLHHQKKSWANHESNSAASSSQEAPPAVAASAAKSPPVAAASAPKFSVDWKALTSKTDLDKTREVYQVDAGSAEGYNTHVSSYYYYSDTWGTSPPQSPLVLRLLSTPRRRWGWLQDWRRCHRSLVAWAQSTLGLGLAQDSWSTKRHHLRHVLCCHQCEVGWRATVCRSSFSPLSQVHPESPQGHWQEVGEASIQHVHHPPSPPKWAGSAMVCYAGAIDAITTKWRLGLGSLLARKQQRRLPILDSPPQQLGGMLTTSPRLVAMLFVIKSCQWSSTHHVGHAEAACHQVKEHAHATNANRKNHFLSERVWAKVSWECPQFLWEKIQFGGKDCDYMNAIEVYEKDAHHLIVPVNVWFISWRGTEPWCFCSHFNLKMLIVITAVLAGPLCFDSIVVHLFLSKSPQHVHLRFHLVELTVCLIALWRKRESNKICVFCLKLKKKEWQIGINILTLVGHSIFSTDAKQSHCCKHHTSLNTRAFQNKHVKNHHVSNEEKFWNVLREGSMIENLCETHAGGGFVFISKCHPQGRHTSRRFKRCVFVKLRDW